MLTVEGKANGYFFESTAVKKRDEIAYMGISEIWKVSIDKLKCHSIIIPKWQKSNQQ